MTKMLVFDMDGTIANLYGVEGWLADLRNENPRPYVECKPMYDMVELKNILEELKKLGWRIVVTTWLSKNSSVEYKKVVTYAKKKWLANYEFPYDEFHGVQYGTTKANCTRGKADFQILIDDNEKVRKGWRLGATIDANKNILEILKAFV